MKKAATRGSTPQTSNFIKEETLAKMFSSEFDEIFKNIFFTEHLWMTASVMSDY